MRRLESNVSVKLRTYTGFEEKFVTQLKPILISQTNTVEYSDTYAATGAGVMKSNRRLSPGGAGAAAGRLGEGASFNEFSMA